MKITVNDDKKEKYTSWSAKIEELDLIGFGANDVEAIADLKRQVQGLVAKLKNIDYDNIELVDGFGKPIKSGAV